MKQEFQMTAEEFEQIKAIAQRPAIPVMKIGNVFTGNEKQEDANAFWKGLAYKYGFEWDSVEPVSGKDHIYFVATPKKN
jgi:hypothetical protein